jgi:hypothetical protein
VDAQVKRGKSSTSGRRRQFAALYPNADEPGHRLNSRLRARLTEFACIDQQCRDLPVCTVELENKSDESPFFPFTTFNFRLPASSRMVATSGQHDWAPFLSAILLFLASLGGLGASVWLYPFLMS